MDDGIDLCLGWLEPLVPIFRDNYNGVRIEEGIEVFDHGTSFGIFLSILVHFPLKSIKAALIEVQCAIPCERVVTLKEYPRAPEWICRIEYNKTDRYAFSLGAIMRLHFAADR